MNKIVPQWLREVLNRGFKPKKIYHDCDNFLFGYINSSSKKIIKIPNKKIFVIEGLPGMGKTSIINFFRKSKEILTVEQILPKEPKFDQAMTQSFYFKSDELKTKKIFTSNFKHYLFDRYYVSTLAFYWAYDKIHKTQTYNHAINWYKNSIFSYNLIKPFFVFYINASLDVSLIRKNRIASKYYENLWQNKRFLYHFKKYYQYFYSEIEPQTPVVKLSGNETLNNLTKIIKKYIDEAK